MTPRETVIEAMAGEIESSGFDMAFYISEKALDALLAALPTIGLKLVQVEATEGMIHNAVMTFVRENGGIEHAPYLTWAAMLAACPNVLGDRK